MLGRTTATASSATAARTDSAVPVPVSGLASGVTAISTGGDHSCAVKDDGVWCWGDNSGGQLGDDRPTGSDVPVAVSGLSERRHRDRLGRWQPCFETGPTLRRPRCALKEGGVWCWGGTSPASSGTTARRTAPCRWRCRGLRADVSAISGRVHLRAEGRQPLVLGPQLLAARQPARRTATCRWRCRG